MNLPQYALHLCSTSRASLAFTSRLSGSIFSDFSHRPGDLVQMNLSLSSSARVGTNLRRASSSDQSTSSASSLPGAFPVLAVGIFAQSKM